MVSLQITFEEMKSNNNQRQTQGAGRACTNDKRKTTSDKHQAQAERVRARTFEGTYIANIYTHTHTQKETQQNTHTLNCCRKTNVFD